MAEDSHCDQKRNLSPRTRAPDFHSETRRGTAEFVKRYLRHVLPSGLRSIRYYGFCHPAAKVKQRLGRTASRVY
jgi:hypothetical protein